MRKIKGIGFILASLFLFAACSPDNPEEQDSNFNVSSGELSAFVEGDAVSVFDGKANRQFTYHDGKLQGEHIASDAVFAAFPYNAGYFISANGFRFVLETSLTPEEGEPARQIYASSLENGGFCFRKLLSSVRFALSSDKVCSIRFRSADDTPISGNVDVSFGPDGLPVTSGDFYRVILTPSSGDCFKPGNYEFAVLPSELAKGWTMELVGPTEKTVTIESETEIALKRGETLELGAVDQDFVDPDPGVPYISAAKAPEVPGTGIQVVTCSGAGASQMLLVASLQGVMNRSGARVLVSKYTHSKWGDHLLSSDSNAKSVKYTDFLSAYLKYANGYVLVDDSTRLVGASLAGPMGAVLMDITAAEKYGASMKMLLDVRGKDEEWLYRTVVKNRELFNFDGILQPVTTEPIMGIDNAIATDRIAINCAGNEELCRKFYSLINPNSPRLGFGVPFGDEFEDVAFAAEYGLYTIPADWAQNYSFYQQYKVAVTPLDQKAATMPERTKAHYVMLMWSDGDNLDFALKDMAFSSKYLASSKCAGKKIGWEMPPSLCETMPFIFSWYKSHCPKDNFYIGATSGAGYTYPSHHKNFQDFATKTGEMLKTAGLDYLNVLDYGEFSGAEEKAALETLLKEAPDLKGIFYMDYANYAGWNGAMQMIDSRPVISFRHRLWADLDPYESVAERINQSSTDVTSPDAYSAVVIHAWSYSMDDVAKFISLLDDDVVLVDADEFVSLIRRNVPGM